MQGRLQPALSIFKAKERYTGSHVLSQEHTRPEALPKPTVWTSLEKVIPTQAWIPEKAQLSQGDPS